MSLVLLQLGFKAFKQGKGIGRGAGETGQHFAVMEFSHLAGGAFDDNIAQGHLTVAPDGDRITFGRLASYADDGCTVKLFHAI